MNENVNDAQLVRHFFVHTSVYFVLFHDLITMVHNESVLYNLM